MLIGMSVLIIVIGIFYLLPMLYIHFVIANGYDDMGFIFSFIPICNIFIAILIFSESDFFRGLKEKYLSLYRKNK